MKGHLTMNRRTHLAASLAALAAWAPAQAGAQAGAQERAAVELVRTFYAAVDARADVGTLEGFFAPDFSDHDRPANALEGIPDRAVALALFGELASGFPDGADRLDIPAPVGLDTAMVYWTFTGTHEGPFFGIPASGRSVEINGVDVFLVEDGRFDEQWHVEELMSLFAQIGASG
jgi:hypothetical protein